MIDFSNVTLWYPRAPSPAVRALSLRVDRGSLTAVVGPNGSGKSTLIRALLGRVPLTAGSITVSGTNIATLSRRETASRIAVLPQRELPVFPTSVRDYVALGRLAPRDGWRESASDAIAIDAALERAEATLLRDRATDALSGGEWQRVRIARALAQGAPTLALDEPTAFLDIGHEMAVFELLHGLVETGTTVLLVSHQLNLVARFADHIVLLSQGEVAADGPPVDVMRPETLERVYEWPLIVTRDPLTGAPALLPLRRRGVA